MHLGVIPDGNRRYAKEEGIENSEAYRQAKNVIGKVFENHEKLPAEIDELTIYLLSEENLRRGEEELETLFDLLHENMEQLLERINGANIDTEKVKEIAEKTDIDIENPGKLEQFDRDQFSFNWATTRPEIVPDRIQEKMRELEERFSDGERQLNALISYTGKKDILEATRKVKEKDLELNQENIRKELEISTDMDFVIRTGNNPRRECLSGFPIWNSSYAEYYHIEKHFPRITSDDVAEALEHYQKLRRKKGS